VIKRMLAVVGTSVLVLLGTVGLAGPMGAAAHADTASEAAQFLSLLNGLRAQQGVGPLGVDTRLVSVAQGWSDHMAGDHTLEHNPNLAAQAPGGWSLLGENVGYGPTVQGLHDAFVNSPHHYENMIEPSYNAVGIAVSHTSDGLIWVTVDFEAERVPQVVASQGPGVANPTAGYWQVGRDGGVFSYGAAAFHGSTGNIHLNQPIVGMAGRPDHNGYWFVAADGGVFAYDTGFYGSTGGIHLNQPIVGMAATPSGNGYWLVARDGGIFAYGDAGFFGSTGGMVLNQPIVGMASTPSGNGYWLVARDGGIFAFGDAGFYGSAAGLTGAPIVGMAHSAHGYWVAAADGGIFAFGDAGFDGSAAGATGGSSIVSIAPSASSHGYELSAANGSVYTYGDAEFDGSSAGTPLNAPIVGMATL
jgi:hypothetical protein